MSNDKKPPAPRWSKAIREYVVSELATWKPRAQIWREVTDAELMNERGITALDPRIHTYSSFMHRCKRIPQQDISEAHELWKANFYGIRWAEEKARAQGLSDLIDRVNKTIDDGVFSKDRTGTLAALVGQLRGLYEQLRKELSAEEERKALAASGTRVMLGNPLNVQIDGPLVAELIMTFRKEIGGLHTLNFNSLNLQELQILNAEIERVINEKLAAIPETDAELTLNDDDEDEDGN